MLAAQLLDDALSNDMVGQAAKGLDADDVPGAALDEHQHFPGQEPAFPGLVSQGDEAAGHGRQVFDLCGRREVDTLFQGDPRRLQHFPGQEPAFPGLVSQGDEAAGHGRQVFDLCGRREVDTLFQGDPRRLAEILQKGDRRIAEPGGGVLRPQMPGLEIAVVEAVQQKLKLLL